MRMIIAAAAISAVLVGVAQAQTTAPRPSTPDRPGAVRPEIPPPSGSGSSGASSEDLSRSGGVIRPPSGVDPGMNQPPPSTGPQTMPVVPPPGTPGGNPDVQPK